MLSILQLAFGTYDIFESLGVWFWQVSQECQIQSFIPAVRIGPWHLIIALLG